MITVEEAMKAIREMQEEENMTDDEILGILCLMFQDNKLTFNELGALIDKLGYEFTDEFLNMSPEDQKSKCFEECDE